MLHYKLRHSQRADQSSSARSRPQPRNPDCHLAGGQKHKRIDEESIKRVGQIIQSKPSRSFDVIAQPENAMHFDPERASSSAQQLVTGQQHRPRRRSRQLQAETIVD